MWPFKRKATTPKTPEPAPVPVPVAPPAPPVSPYESQYQLQASIMRRRSEIDDGSSDSAEAYERELLRDLGIPAHWLPLQTVNRQTEVPFMPPTAPPAMRGNPMALAAWHDYHQALSLGSNPMDRYRSVTKSKPILRMSDLAKHRRDLELAGYVTLEPQPELEGREIVHPFKRTY
jgi:hypothetical protein